MESEHTLQLLPDYALGLLPAEERRRVESHARQCPACRLALQRERGVEALVRDAVHSAARPAPGRLNALRPAAPAARLRPLPLYRLAPATLVALLLALVLLFGPARPSSSPALFGPGVATAAGSPAAEATATVTTTHTPTATLAAAVSPADLTATQPPPDGDNRPPRPVATPIVVAPTP
jgi:anti-sigma factor RsiW